MKKHFLLIVFSLSIITSNVAQHIEWNTQPEIASEMNAVLPTLDGNWILGGKASRPYLIELDSIGNSIWGLATFGSYKGIIEEIIYDSDTSFILAGGTFSEVNGDVVTPGLGFIYRFHNSGYILEDLSIRVHNSYAHKFKTMDLLPNHSIVLVTDNKQSYSNPKHDLFVVSPDGNILWEKNLSYHVRDILTLDDNSFVVLNSTGDVAKYHSDFTLGNTFSSGERIHQIENFNTQSFIGISKSEIFLLDSNFQIQQSYNHPEIDSFIHFHVYENEIFATGKSIEKSPFVLHLDNQFQTLLYFTFGNKTIFPNKILATENEIGITGKVSIDTLFTAFDTYFSSSMFFKTFSKIGFHQDFAKDVSIENIEVGSFQAEYLEQYYYRLKLKNVKITIRNNGVDTLDNLKITKPSGGLEKLFNLNLPPGESSRVSLTDFSFLSVDILSEYKYELCFTIGIPDQKFDINPSDNKLCKTFDLDMDFEKSISENSGLIYPNPVIGDEFYFSAWLLPQDYNLKIVNAIGQPVIQTDYNYSIHNYQSRKVNVSNLSDGVYFLILENEDDRKVIPFVKE